jgi:hypothetical protein
MWTCKNCGATHIDDSKEFCFECMTPSEIKPLPVITDTKPEIKPLPVITDTKPEIKPLPVIADTKPEIKPLPVIADTKPEIKPLPGIFANSGLSNSGSGVSNSGFENTLTATGWFLLWVGVLVGVFFIWKSGDITKKYESIDTWGEHGYAWSLIIFGIFSIMQGLFMRFILEGVAVIIRLLRRMK